MGFRSYFFVRRHFVRNFGSTLMSRHRFSVTKIVFSSAVSASLSTATDLLPVSDLV
jgi:hypothetical protein